MKRIISYINKTTPTFGRLTICIVMLMVTAISYGISPEEMPNVNRADYREFISDPGGYLSPAVKAQVNSELLRLRQSSTAEVVVVIPPSIDDLTANEWCEQLFTSWGIGKDDKDNGLLIMISPESRQAYIMTGYGMEGNFTDYVCKQIIERTIIPNMKEDNLAGAVESSVGMVSRIIADPSVAEEIRSQQRDNRDGDMEPISKEVVLNFLLFVAGGIFLCTLVYFIYDAVKARKYRDNYSRAELWRKDLTKYLLMGILSLGTGLIFFILSFLLYRYWRTKRLKCPTCGSKMHRLPEDEDNQLLNDSQDFEERLNTVDYDVWECDKCGTVERFPYKVKQNIYTECPLCHTIAMSLKCDITTRPATVRQTGEGVKIYECKFCGHQEHKPYKIPKREDPTAALAAGAIIGSTLGRGGGGHSGGGFGGGFGGGSTGGGGAGGSW